jgi:alpha-glucosidase (family GH31 glycosyl hydrolase)
MAVSGHRYLTVGSGDTYEDYATLTFQIYLTLTAANVGVEWSHDLGAFMSTNWSTIVNDTFWLHNAELYTRWVQAGVWQPVFRTHVSENGQNWPWLYPSVLPELQAAFQARNALVPYLYTCAFDAFASGVLAVHPMYYDFPEADEAYQVSTLVAGGAPLQHMVGDAFTVSPITRPADAVPSSGGLAAWPLWVPPGTWVDCTNGVVLTGSQWYTRNYTLAETPCLERAGSVVPSKGLHDAHAVAPATLRLVVAWLASSGGAGPISISGGGRVYEDDGASLRYQQGFYSLGAASWRVDVDAAVASFAWRPQVEGAGYDGQTAQRTIELRVRRAPATATGMACQVDPVAPDAEFTWRWEAEAPPS